MKQDTILDAWCNGYVAAYKGLSLGDNPYPEHARLSGAWARAWHKSRRARTAGLPAPPLTLRWSGGRPAPSGPEGREVARTASLLP